MSGQANLMTIAFEIHISMKMSDLVTSDAFFCARPCNTNVLSDNTNELYYAVNEHLD